GNIVYAIEPNREMRGAAERLLSAYPNFRSLDGRAEATTLPAESVDFVTAGQAFHWFDREGARAEFARVLRPGGWVALVWNLRQIGTTPFLRAYEQLLNTYGTDYADVHFKGDNTEETLHDYYGGDGPQILTFRNSQQFDFEGLKGRLLSSSYTPEPGHSNHEPMLRALREIFEAHQVDGKVTFLYDTRLYYGHLARG
ncbi:MAG: class I SAM-dependent methyltransferase, partial [Chloroflexota bacterium]|nr:class I SAM-dependent methyltransferase [Chloroflexota bacterium]